MPLLLEFEKTDQFSIYRGAILVRSAARSGNVIAEVRRNSSTGQRCATFSSSPTLTLDELKELIEYMEGH